MVNWLCSHGFQMKWIEPSQTDKGRQVFIFDDTKELRQCMSLFKEKQNNERSH